MFKFKNLVVAYCTKCLLLLISLCPVAALAQQNLKGSIFDNQGKALPFATAALLHPADSTLAYFGISNELGAFEIKNVKNGTYLLQSAYLGFKPFYKTIETPLANGGTLPTVVLSPENRDLKTVEIEGERVPIAIKGDTVEYNAGAFKTKPDASVEDLLRKLPGVEVDRAGNLKAQGEDVKKVLVDGKEFFGGDQKIATKNLPADAIKKVQVFDKGSDQSEFTGIDDGTRDKTINLMLKDDKKNGSFGDVQGGVGTKDKYQISGKIYNFKPTTQFGALGMLNNINQFGFSFQDYLNFRGGIGSLMSGGSGGRIDLGGRNAPPINFGQPINGLVTSGAAGINYTYEPRKNNRFNVSYLGNGSKKYLDQNTYSKNFTNEQTFERNQSSQETTNDRAHGFSTSYRNDLDSAKQITFNGTVNLNSGKTSSKAFTQSLLEKAAFNQLDNSTLGTNSGVSASTGLNYVHKFHGGWPLLKTFVEAGTNQSLNNDEWNNLTTLFNPNLTLAMNQYQKNQTAERNYGAGATITRKLWGGYLLDASLRGNWNNDQYWRSQGTPPNENSVVDSLSVNFSRKVSGLRPAILVKKNTEKIKFNVGLALESGQINSGLKDSAVVNTSYAYLLPRLTLENEYSNSKRIGFRYESRLTTPSINQLQPIVNTANPFSLFRGNQNLKPEISHNAGVNWMWFDQFSFTSIFANLAGTYTHDKINMSRKVNSQNLAQEITYVNVNDDYKADANFEFSTPIRKLGLNLEVALGETYNRGINPVNGVNNVNTNYTHEAELTFKNRKADKITVSVGGALKYTEAQYSIQKSLNNKFYNIGYFTDVNYSPSEKWNIAFTADVSRYQSQSFNNAVTIPLLQAEVSHYFLKANRASLTLKVFDILNQNSGLQRVSELNYLQETRSNIIGQYAMLTFKYRLSKLGDGSGGMNIQVKNRR